jgi:quinol monooxygenase YgiN
MQMVSFTVRMTFRQEDRTEIAEILKALTVESRKESGCVSYIPHIVESDADTVLIYEQYADEAAVEFHKSTPHFAKYAVGGLYQKMLERQVEALNALA